MMQSWLIAAFCSFLLTVYSVNGVKISNSPAVKNRATTGGETVVCNQYIGMNGSAHEAIKKLDEKLTKKMDELIQLLQGKPAINPGGASTNCKEIYKKSLFHENKAYLLNVGPGHAKVPVYCHMTSAGLGSCGGGGWTLVMKMDGAKRTFHYNSPLWSNKNDFNLPGGRSGLDHHETKLPTYWSTPFSKICLAMKVGHQINSFVVHKQANSLYSLIADGVYRPTSLGRNTWKTLIGPKQGSLQPHCNMEGFNAVANNKARIGILGNNENDCKTCDSRIGFGMAGWPDDMNICGDEAHGGDNGTKHIKTMGYIFVQ